MKYVVYNKTTGEVVRAGDCPPALLAKQAGKDPDLAATEGDGNDLDHVVTKDGLRKRPVAQIASRRAKLAEAMRLPPTALNRTERILKHLKKQGIDLGPDGADL